MPFLSLNELVLTLTLGAALGFFGGLFGIGGGIIAIPLLVLGFGIYGLIGLMRMLHWI